MTSPDLKAINDRFLRATGATIRQWALFEQTLWFYLAVLLRTSDQFRVRVIWASLPTYQSRRTLLRRLAATYLDGETLRTTEKFFQRASKLASNRNMLAHSLGGLDEDGKVWLFGDEFDEEMGMNFLSQVRLQITNVEGWPKDIEKLSKEMMMWLPTLEAAVQTSAKMHREPPQDPVIPPRSRPIRGMPDKQP